MTPSRPHAATAGESADVGVRTVSLILKTGMPTNLGTIKGIGTDSLGVNSKGQVAMVVSYDQGQAGTSQPTLVLLNPTGP